MNFCLYWTLVNMNWASSFQHIWKTYYDVCTSAYADISLLVWNEALSWLTLAPLSSDSKVIFILDFFFFFLIVTDLSKKKLIVTGGGIWTMDVSIGNTTKCQLSYKALGYLSIYTRIFTCITLPQYIIWNLAYYCGESKLMSPINLQGLYSWTITLM